MSDGKKQQKNRSDPIKQRRFHVLPPEIIRRHCIPFAIGRAIRKLFRTRSLSVVSPKLGRSMLRLQGLGTIGTRDVADQLPAAGRPATSREKAAQKEKK